MPSTSPTTAEFLDKNGVTKKFGITHTPLYRLRKAGLIKSVSLREPGAKYGKRLYCVASIRGYLDECERRERLESSATDSRTSTN